MRRNRNKIQEELQGLTELNLCPWLVVSSHLKWISILKKEEGFFFFLTEDNASYINSGANKVPKDRLN